MISVVQLGQVDYATGLRLQQKLVELRKAGQIGDVLLLLEHSPVITLGRNAKAANVLSSPEELSRRGVEVFECDRGGDVTFHGPGQLVGYPIFDLRGSRSSQLSAAGSQESRSRVLGVKSQDNSSASSLNNPQLEEESWLSKRGTLGAVDYVRRVEEVLIRTCADFGIPAKRVAGLTGAWTVAEPEAKIAAIGVHISRAVTSHGFALNVNNDLSYFDLIVPCGITSKPVTSMQRALGQDIDQQAVAESVARHFGRVFSRQILWVDTLDELFGNVVGVPMKPPSGMREEDETSWA